MNIAKLIKKEGLVSLKVRSKYFRDYDILEIRDWLEQKGLDRYMPIEAISSEIAICTPQGILMQVRATDNDLLGLWGGIADCGEKPIECAVRELEEESKFKVKEEDLQFIEINKHNHLYANGNKSIAVAHRYILELNYVPKLVLNDESSGTKLLTSFKDVKSVIIHQRSFVARVIIDKYL